jgi:type III secretion protein V
VQTVGDGLVAQIPALLTCLTAAILVTRVDPSGKSAAKDAKPRTFGGDLLNQLGGYPKALWGLAVVMVVFGVIPGMPAIVFGCLAAVAGGLAYSVQRQANAKEKPDAAKPPSVKEGADAAIVYEFQQMEPLQVVFPAGTEELPEVKALTYEVNEARNELVRGMGMSLPVFTYRHEEALPADSIEFRVYEVPMMRMPFRPGDMAVGDRHAQQAAALQGAQIEVGAGAHGTDLVWLAPQALVGQEELSRVAMSWVTCTRERIKRKLMRYGPRFTGVQSAQKYMGWMEGWMPELAKELQKNLSTSKLADVTQRLLREGISIRNMRLIMETLAEVGQRERDPAVLTEFVRYALREQLCHELAPGGRLEVYVLAPDLEDLLTQSIRQGSAGAFLALSPEDSARVVDAVRTTVTQHQERGTTAVIVCAQDVRRFLRTMLEPDLPEVVIMSVGELSPEVAVSVRATVERPLET